MEDMVCIRLKRHVGLPNTNSHRLPVHRVTQLVKGLTWGFSYLQLKERIRIPTAIYRSCQTMYVRHTDAENNETLKLRNCKIMVDKMYSKSTNALFPLRDATFVFKQPHKKWERVFSFPTIHVFFNATKQKRLVSKKVRESTKRSALVLRTTRLPRLNSDDTSTSSRVG